MQIVSLRLVCGSASFTRLRFVSTPRKSLFLRKRNVPIYKELISRGIVLSLKCRSENGDANIVSSSSEMKPSSPNSKPEEEIIQVEKLPPSKRPNPLLWIVQFFALLAQRMSKLFQPRFIRLTFVLVLFICGNLFYQSRRSYNANVLYSEFVKQVESGMVETVFFESKSNNIQFTYSPKMWDNLREKIMSTNHVTEEQAEKRFKKIQIRSKVVPGQTDSLTQLLQKKQVRYGVAEQPMTSSLGAFLWTIAILWIPFLPLVYFFRKSIDARLGGSKGKKLKTTSASMRVKFSDVAGMDEAKEELLEVVDLLKDPTKYKALNVKIPSGVLLCGPTGTGKTLLARAVAGEAGVPFFAVSASEFVEMFVGRGAARIRELFKEARKHSPCVVFIDEIDSVGGVRGNSFNEERDQTLNQLLVELDGFEDNQSIVLLAATNRFKSLDPALLRPGRLTRKIKIPLPDLRARAAILAVHLREVPMENVEEKIEACSLIARLSIGFSGAELANTVNEAALMAARDNRDKIHIRDLMRGLQRTKYPVNETSFLPKWLNSFQTSIINQSWSKSYRQLPPP